MKRKECKPKLFNRTPYMFGKIKPSLLHIITLRAIGNPCCGKTVLLNDLKPFCKALGYTIRKSEREDEIELTWRG